MSKDGELAGNRQTKERMRPYRKWTWPHSYVLGGQQLSADRTRERPGETRHTERMRNDMS